MRIRSNRLARCVAALAVFTSGAAAQTYVAEFTASNPAAHDRFGYSVAAHANRFVVGSAHANGPVAPADTGAVYVYRLGGSSWHEEVRLIAPDATNSAMFGASVAVQGSEVFVGAPQATHNGARTGAVYSFGFNGTAWVLQQKLIAAGTVQSDQFGSSLAVEGNRLVVGAPGADPGMIPGAGTAYVFERQGGVWVERTALTATSSNAGAALGTAVAIHNGAVAVSAPAEYTDVMDSGAILIYEEVGQSWVQTARVKDPGRHAYDHFGESFVFSGDRLIVGAPDADDGGRCSGKVVVLERQGVGWAWITNLVPNELSAGSRLGASVCASADLVSIGATNGHLDPNDGGRVWSFGLSGSHWIELGSLTAPTGSATEGFGSRQALVGDQLVVSSWGEVDVSPNGGSVHMWDLTTMPEYAAFCYGQGCPCGNEDSEAGCRNSTGRGARLQAWGSLSLSANDLVIGVDHLAVNRMGIVFMGAAQVQTAFGDGLRCVGPGPGGYLMFGPARSTGESGVLSLGPGGFAHRPGVHAGATRHFQAWYRDHLGPCNQPFNLSNGIALTFMP